MKSGRYKLLPRVREVKGLINGMETVRYICTWKDPGDLPQRRGEPINYKRVFLGYGYTADEAIKACHMEYLDWCAIVGRRSVTERYLYGDGRFVKPTPQYEVPAHCIVTPNKPRSFWQWLFV